MELFAKIVNDFQSLTVFAKKAPSEIFDWILNALLLGLQHKMLIAKTLKFLENTYCYIKLFHDRGCFHIETRPGTSIMKELNCCKILANFRIIGITRTKWYNIFYNQDVHPFYADLMNVLYDKDHYKLALGQINTAKHLIDK